MSGFKDDVISILKTAGVLQKEASGWIMDEDGRKSSETYELYSTLTKQRFPVVHSHVDDFIVFDYVVMDRYNRNVQNLIWGMSKLHVGGIMVIQGGEEFQKKYISMFGNFTATKVRYDDREYLVIHSGVDYGN